MAHRPNRVCQHPGCPSFAVERGRCHVHRIVRIDTRPSSSARGYDREWQRIRAAVLSEQPMCWTGCGRPARDVHHITPLRQGGTHDRGNLVALCRSCHLKAERALQRPAVTR